MRTVRNTSFALALVASACTSGAPPGFTSAVGGGDRWSFPLVGPLENGLLVTPVTVGQYGPYLFAIDPDAQISVVDGELVKQTQLRTFNGPHRLDEADTQQARIYAEIVGLEIGSLIIERVDVIIVKTSTYDFAGRGIHGVIGKDVLADSLVFGFDREQGLGHLMTKAAFKPQGGIAIPYQELKTQIQNAQVPPLARRIAKATINGEPFTMHLDLGATASQLRESAWERGKLVPRELTAGVMDEVGILRRVKQVSEPAPVTLGTAENPRVVFVPYGDKRWPEQDLDGALGLGFFAPYTVWHDWTARTYHLGPRMPVPVGRRIGRWDTGPLAKCKDNGCVTFRLVDPLAGKTLEEGKTHPGVVLSLTRDERAGGSDLEVVLEAMARPDLPRLIVNLPAHLDRVIDQLPAGFVGTTLQVIDASPYPRPCPSKGACVDKLAR
ncbi:MAG TPA: retropepsin-like aspartic protease [Kofleriaceae bacterium]